MKAGYFAYLLLFPWLLGRSANFATPPAQPSPALLAAVAIGSPQTQAGTNQILQIRLTESAGPEISFRLNLTYPSGATQEVTDIISDRIATLTWTVPSDAAVGMAQYELYAIDCGCGNRTQSRPASSNPENVRGEFQIN